MRRMIRRDEHPLAVLQSTKQVLLPGDIIQVVHDRNWVSFMYSYVNLIPLPPSKVQHLVQAVEPYDFDRIYSPWLERIVMTDGKTVVHRSAERYISSIRD